jgi:ABC transport system ATP-binding/permease protein
MPLNVIKFKKYTKSLGHLQAKTRMTCDNSGCIINLLAFWPHPSPMSSPALISLQRAHLAFGHHALLDDVNFSIVKRERVGLIGRNGAGKSSLLKLLDGRVLPDDGKVVSLDSLRISTVEQEPELDTTLSVIEVLLLPPKGDENFDDEDWQKPARALAWLDKLGIDPDTSVSALSGGMRKRVALAAALVHNPDLLLLDEPTNHLDLEGITWLEAQLKSTQAGVLFITHDRAFLDSVATRIIELDRGKLLSFPGNFSAWQVHKEEWLNAQSQENARFDKLLAQEEVWIRKGVEARRTRNEGRVRRLEQLRRERTDRRDVAGKVNLAIDSSQRSGKLVAELENVSKSFGEKVIVENFSTTIMRGDRIGFIGPNGAGKSTLLQIILGVLQPDQGEVKLGTNIQIAYFDQMRSQLDENATLADVINPGSEWIEIGQSRKHVMSYLNDFLFEPARAQSPVSSLSGGERARLLLARLFARPANILVLDEPTNDLDIETLELLESLLLEFPGTVLLVSHDRLFLDNVVTQTIVAEGDGHWAGYVGGYQDWLVQKATQESVATQEKPNGSARLANASSAAQATVAPTNSSSKAQSASRMAPWELRELEDLPAKIQALEAEQAQWVEKLASPELYQAQDGVLDTVQAKIESVENELNKNFARWEALEAKR